MPAFGDAHDPRDDRRRSREAVGKGAQLKRRPDRDVERIGKSSTDNERHWLVGHLCRRKRAAPQHSPGPPLGTLRDREEGHAHRAARAAQCESAIPSHQRNVPHLRQGRQFPDQHGSMRDRHSQGGQGVGCDDANIVTTPIQQIAKGDQQPPRK
jgi:hypothetical protein